MIDIGKGNEDNGEYVLRKSKNAGTGSECPE